MAENTPDSDEQPDNLIAGKLPHPETSAGLFPIPEEFVPPSNPQLPMDEGGDTPSDRVPVMQKIGYGLGTFPDMWGHWLYPTIAFQIFGLYLHVPQWQIGVAVILNRV